MGWVSTTIRCARPLDRYRGCTDWWRPLGGVFLGAGGDIVVYLSYQTWPHTEMKSNTFPSSSTPDWCVLAGLMRASCRSAPRGAGVVGTDWSTRPFSLYSSSSPGRLRWAAYASGTRPHGGPPLEKSLPSGHSRQISLPPSGFSSSDILFAHFGRPSGGSAQKNYARRHDPSSQARRG